MLSSGFTPVKYLVLNGNLLYVVTSTLVEAVTGYRVFTCLHSPAFDAPFINKLLGVELLERLLQNALTCVDQTRF